MNDVTRILTGLARGDTHAAGLLLPLVYEELRKLAAVQMAEEVPGNTLNATALVHEAYLRLVGPADEVRWENRGHFFAAAAMRRILVDAARRKRAEKHGWLTLLDALDILFLLGGITRPHDCIPQAPDWGCEGWSFGRSIPGDLLVASVVCETRSYHKLAGAK